VISEAPKEGRSRGVWVVFELLASSRMDFVMVVVVLQCI
jgi:hypothetical protein